MKVILVENFGGPEELRLAEIPAPEPAAGHVLVRVNAAGVNPVDTYIRSGTYAQKPPLPYTPGLDGAGVIEHIGEGVSGWREGQRVYVAGSLSGTYAELALCKAAQVHALPDDISFAQGAAIGTPFVTAHFALFRRARATAGETVLVHGATGGVGLAAVQLARAAGLTVFGTAGSAPGCILIEEQGVHRAFDHHKPGYLDEIKAATDGRGVDVILEMLANVNLGKDLTILAPNGRIAVIGSRGPVEINPRDAMARNADILGVMLSGAPPEVLAAIHDALRTGLESGALRPVVGRELPLEDAAEAHRAVMSPGALGKIVLVP
ncbi:MAG: NADPH:quinone reductase [Chthoniobacteraceae bacterium]